MCHCISYPVCICKLYFRTCSHFNNVQQGSNDKKGPYLADLVLKHYQTMMHLIQSLGACNSNIMAMILGSSGMPSLVQDNFIGLDPISVGDCIFQILCSLNKLATDIKLILKPIYDYLSFSASGNYFFLSYKILCKKSCEFCFFFPPFL